MHRVAEGSAPAQHSPPQQQQHTLQLSGAAVTAPEPSQHLCLLQRGWWWSVGEGTKSSVSPLCYLPEVDFLCYHCNFCIPMHLSTAYSPLVYWALNLACYLWQIYDNIHYSSNSFRQKLKSVQRKWIIPNNYTIKKAVMEHCDSAQKWNERYRQGQWWCVGFFCLVLFCCCFLFWFCF